ncbi:MAG TPA: S8 family peptidase [Ideonella sp.]|uniref:S8 family peptidase n=1 Tax=Ideonella sp. TaxID=1929293 RepID=UPI002E3738E7|nr:S8 family peptidase [Ideonella sp.]HEX5687468.1 S8 family peptidase [Ideonella sp.]
MAKRSLPAKTGRAQGTRRIRARSDESSTPAADGLESLVVYVHGIGRHAPPDQLKIEWDLALFGKDLGPRSRMAYWSDLLHPASKARAAKRRKAGSPNEIDLGALLDDAGLPEGNQEAQDYALSMLRVYGVDVDPSSPGARKKVLPLPGFLRRPVSRAFLETFIADTAAYFFRKGMRERIRDRLVEQLKLPPGQHVTVVAHSQGSVVAYEVLSAMTPKQLTLDALVTIGSPLGIREVQDFLEPGSMTVPAVVTRWANFADLLDPVALDKGLAGDFALVSPEQAPIQDELIVNSATRRLVGFNPHSAVGYLAHPKVRRLVAESMRMDVVGRFVVARDVAELLALEDEVRQPVLIEALEPGYRAVDESDAQMEKIETDERAALRVAAHGAAPPLRLEHRIERLAERLRETVVSDVEAAQIDPLRRFVAAKLTASEVRKIGLLHRDLRVYAVWRSSRKSKHTWRSMRPIKADAALTSFGATGQDITWAVLDTGIQANHPHFKGVIKEVWDCTKTGAPVPIPPAQARDRDGHGTHVAGIIAGRRNDQAGDERGVAPAARLVVYKVLQDNGEGEDAWIIKALDHIAAQNEQITDGLAIHGVNLSLGGPFDNTVYGCGFSPLCAELRRLWRAGVLVVVSSGNEGTMQVSTPDGECEINSVMSIGDPANLEECIAVGSVHADKPHLFGISSFSSRGPTADGRTKPDVVAPGERISSCNAAFRAGDPDSLYREESGTSMAAPHVSGLLAAFLSVRREFRGRPDEVKRVLLDACTDLHRDRYHQGHGMPNLMQMLLAV